MRRLMLLAAFASSLLVSSAAFADEAEVDEAADDDDGDKPRKRQSDTDDDEIDAKKGDAKKGDDDAKAKGERTWGNDGDVPTEPDPESVSGEYRWDVHLLDFMTFSVGFLGQAGGTFLDKPDDQTINGARPEPDYPGFAGLTTGIGPTFEVRFLGYAGIELDVLVQSDTGSADLRVTQTTGNQITTGNFSVEIRQDAIHVPLLFKGAIPGRIVTPVLFLGPEFVFPDASSAEIIEGTIPAFHTVTYGAMTPESYTAFIFGLGLEFNLPIPYVDVRIPFNLRGTVNPGVSDLRSERETRTGSPQVAVEFSTEWKFQAVGNIGLSVHF